MFEIFSMGDTQTFAEVLNGIAMMFSNSPIFKGNGPLQLGFGAFVGIVILFAVMIYKAAFEQKFDWHTLIVPLIFYIILTVPKTSVVVSDIYNVEAPKKVDNVPIGLAIPVSVISGMSSVITQYIEKAFYVLPVDNIMRSPTKLTQDGFLTPLQVLNSVRYDNLNTDHPLLQQAFNKVYATCIVGNDQWNPETYTRSKDVSAYFQSVLNSTERLVSFTVSEAGQGSIKTMSCADAGSYIRIALDVHLTDKNNDSTGLLGSNFKKNSFTEKMARAMAVNNTYGKLKGPTGTIKYDYAQVANMISSLTGQSASESRSFLVNVLFDPMVRTASKCTSEFSLDQISKCSAWISTVEQWKDRSAASGTSFLKKMKDGQNMMVLVGFMLFPFMVFMIMLQGMASKKMVAGYIAFILSNYLWLPMAAIINFYGQYTFQDAVYMLKLANPNGIFTISQAPQLYSVVTTKLAVANNAMGMVPVLCSMLFGGMMWGMNAFAKGINPADGGYDANINSKTPISSAPLNSHSSIINKDGFGAATIQGVGSTDIKMNQSISAARSKAAEYDDQISQKLSRLEQLSARSSDGFSNSVSNAQGHRNSTETGTEKLATYNDSTGNSDKVITDGNTHTTKDINESDSLSTNSQKSGNTVIKGDLTLAATAKGGIGGKDKVKAAAGVSIGGDVNVVNSSAVQGKRTVVNQLTENPTFDSTVNNEHGIKGGESKNNQAVTTENLISRIKNSKDANFKATALNEIIQQDQSNNYSIAEKREAAQLASEVQSLSGQKSQALQWVISNSISDSDISGRTNVLAPNSKVVNAALDKTDELGRSNVTNWDQLKGDAEKILRLGGQSTPDAIERVSIFLAARQSGNSEVMLSAMDAIAPSTTVVDTFRERDTLSNLSSANSRMKAEDEKFNSISSTIDAETISKAKEKYGTSFDKADELISSTGDLVKKSNNLTGQEFDPIKQVNVNQISIDKQAKIQNINKEYGDVSSEIASNAPVIKDSNGKLITPTVTSFSDYPTEYDRQIANAQKDGNNEEIIRLLNEKQQLELGNSEAVNKITSELDTKLGAEPKK
ncbi:conjugal transfer protein TraG N-terminal domain-containing protein [Comamonas sp.]|uniref:conjugal transfer protein TraG N-terminal domain-containing protein n=1 Tax=Comamonas sp. TaxID=34028 RepID=UPI0012C5D2D5|nr:conjugal transfer protein TraG N-terminal domain-containing protein [Comamonas sp.]MPS92760.1 conjugal transfer protein TraG [Comamonas sp.]